MAQISADCIKINLVSSDNEEVILCLASLLELKGVVNMRFGGSAVERERTFPTGVPALPYPIAFPHADSATIYRTSIAIGTLAQPVSFRSMEDPNQELPVRAVFLLASRNPQEHVKTLKHFSRFFKIPANLNRLLQIMDPKEAAAWLEKDLLHPSQ